MKNLKRMLIGVLTLVCIGAAAIGLGGCKKEAKRLDVKSYTESSQGLEFELKADEGFYEVTSIGTCTDEVVVIPATYQGFPVGTIGRSAFQAADGVTGVIIPASVKKIKDSAFLACADLVEVVMIGGVTEIETCAFFNCIELKYVELANSVTTIWKQAFGNCTELESIDLPNNITTIGHEAFTQCDSLEELVLPASVKNIGGSAFSGCDKLESITFKGTTQAWEEIKKGYALNDGTPVTEVTCSNGVATL